MIGKFKDETGGRKITEFVGLRPKMYSYTVDGDKNIDASSIIEGSFEPLSNGCLATSLATVAIATSHSNQAWLP